MPTNNTQPSVSATATAGATAIDVRIDQFADDAVRDVDRRLEGLVDCLRAVPRLPVVELINLLAATADAGGTIYVAGNGGSASTAGHLASDLSRCRTTDGRWFRALALTESVARITATANDNRYDCIFEEQLRSFLRPDDVLVCVSVSGRSESLLVAAEWARRHGAKVASLLGTDGGALRELSDVAVVVPTDDYGYAEEIHLALGHLMATSFRGETRVACPMATHVA